MSFQGALEMAVVALEATSGSVDSHNQRLADVDRWRPWRRMRIDELQPFADAWLERATVPSCLEHVPAEHTPAA